MTFQLTILGTSSALSTKDRYPTAQVLNVLGRFFLIDCGEGTQQQLRKYQIGFSRINHILISHLHGDHIFGLIGLISTMALLGRKNDLHIYSHSELQKFLSAQIDFLYNQDFPFKIIYHPINFKKEQKIYEDKIVEIYSFPLKHRIPTCGFRFNEKQQLPNLIKDKILEYNIPIAARQKIKEGDDFVCPNGDVILNSELTQKKPNPKSFAFCTDTKYSDSYINSIKNVDVLYHEATFAKDNSELAKSTFHSTSIDAGKVALKANVGRLLIGHFSSRYKNAEVILNETKEVFVNTTIATEGLKIDF